jgi:quercetin dioxygenase-like cupin family protein
MAISTQTPSGYSLSVDQGDAFWLFGTLQTIKLGSETTDGQYGVLDMIARKGDGSPWHVHAQEDEWVYVLEGEFSFYVADKKFSLAKGGFAFGPRGVSHTILAETDGRCLVGFVPMQFEGFLREAGVPATERLVPQQSAPPPEDWAKLHPVGLKYGTEILGPPGPPPGL